MGCMQCLMRWRNTKPHLHNHNTSVRWGYVCRNRGTICRFASLQYAILFCTGRWRLWYSERSCISKRLGLLRFYILPVCQWKGLSKYHRIPDRRQLGIVDMLGFRWRFTKFHVFGKAECRHRSHLRHSHRQSAGSTDCSGSHHTYLDNDRESRLLYSLKLLERSKNS